MNRNYAVFYNRSLESIFGNQARSVATALNCVARYTDELIFSAENETALEKCVFFDKDVVLGLRLESMGVRLYNNIGSIELCDDKRRTYELLRSSGNVPKTIPSPLLFSDDPAFRAEFTQKVADCLGFPLVAKLAFGSLGQQVRLISSPEELRRCCEEWNGQPHLFQEYIPSSKGKDVRIYVVAGQAIASMERYNPNDFRSNIGAGGRGRKIDPPQGYAQAAVDACALLGLDFGGVDLLYGPQGEPIVCEVNSNALFQELNAVCQVKIEEHIAKTVREESRSFSGISEFFL